MSANYYRQYTTGGGSHVAKRSVKQGRKALPVELKDVRVNITLSPQAHALGVEKAHAAGMTFSAWVEVQIYSIHTEIAET